MTKILSAGQDQTVVLAFQRISLYMTPFFFVYFTILNDLRQFFCLIHQPQLSNQSSNKLLVSHDI